MIDREILIKTAKEFGQSYEWHLNEILQEYDRQNKDCEHKQGILIRHAAKCNDCGVIIETKCG